MRTLTVYTLLICIMMSQACKKNEEKIPAAADTTAVAASAVAKVAYGTLPDGHAVEEYTLKNKNGVELKVINYGGIVTSLKVPDKRGVFEDVVLGFDSLKGYLGGSPYFGAIVGRYGNRIAKGKFTLDGQTYTLAQNNNGQHLHGGLKGFDKVFWQISEVSSSEGASLKLNYTSQDMEEGYPGTLQAEVVYTLTDNNEFKIAYTATTDKKTVVNLTQHTYFNLTGNAKRDILDHQVMLHADKFVPVDKVLIPTGKLKDVTGTPFDFRTATAVGQRVNDKDEQLILGGGYDHAWVLSPADSGKAVASVYEPTSGRFLEVYTTEPAIQFYCGNFLDGTVVGKQGNAYPKRFGLCLETEHYPDSPNQPSFPTVVLNPGETYSTQTTYKFSTK
ncbi:aldose epimerase family protein [Dawidia cretensis]|nr:aldose epimerase family protein [Dawidia cretensis]